MNYCAVAYTFYETDSRVKRYAEMYAKRGNIIHAIVLRRNLKLEENNTRLKGIKLFYASSRALDKNSKFHYIFNYLKFFIKGFIILSLNHIRFHYSIIHVHNIPDFLIFMAIIPKLMGAKIILDIHDIMPELYCEKYGKSFKSKFMKLLLFLERKSVRFADYTITANDLWLKKIRSRTKISQARSSALLNYPDTTIFSPLVKASHKKSPNLKLIYAGHISYYHGIDIAIRAFAQVIEQFPDAKFDIYARTYVISYLHQIETLIRNLYLGQQLIINKGIGPYEVAEKMRSCHIGVVPKRGTYFAAEAFSTKILELFATGTPVIASRTTIDTYYFKDDLIEYFEDNNHEDLALKIIRLYRDPRRQQQLSENGLLYVKHNNWQAKSHLFSTIVDSLLSGH